MKNFLFGALLFVVFSGYAQNISKNGLEEIRDNQVSTQKTGMFILGSWAILNLASSPVLSARSTGHTKYFHQMNGFWNIVNLGLAGVSLLTIDNAIDQVSYNSIISEQIKLEKILLFNAGLDIGYIATGFFLRERSKSMQKNSDRFLGFGNSLILQGGFLFLFDIGFYIAYNSHFSDLLKISENISLHLSPAAFNLALRF